MDLRIDDLQEWYTSGDVITGSVIVRGQVYANAAQVILEGRAKSRIVVKRNNGQTSSTHVYRGRTLLLHEFQLVPPSLQNVGAGNRGPQVFPFRIVIPDHVQNTKEEMIRQNSEGGIFKTSYWTNWNPANPGYYAPTAGHPLPPTFSLDGRGFSGKYSAFISYAIKASVLLNGTQAAREVPIRILMRPTPANILQARLEQIHRHQQLVRFANPKLSPEYADRDLKFKEKMTFMFHSNRVPSHTFSVSATCPKTMVLGAPIQVDIRLSHDIPNLPPTQVAERPTITVGKIQVSLNCDTHIRAPATFSDKTRHDTEKKAWISGVPNLNHSFSKENEYSLTWFSQPLPIQASPSFATYNIRRSYTARIKLELLCAGKTEEIKRDYLVSVEPWPFGDFANDPTQSNGGEGSSSAVQPAARTSRRAGMGFGALKNPEADDDDDQPPPPTYHQAVNDPTPVVAPQAVVQPSIQPSIQPSGQPSVQPDLDAAGPSTSQSAEVPAIDASAELAAGMQNVKLAEPPKVY